MLDLVFYLLLILNAFILLIIIYNYLTAPRIRIIAEEVIVDNPKISILIPARNEEKNIGECLDSVLSQTHQNYKVIVLDDQSGDKTVEIVKSYTEKDERISLIHGNSLPDGWLGKNWACHQLSKQSESSLMLFLDADVRLTSSSIHQVLNLFHQNKLKMLSVFPTQIIDNFGSWLITPMMNWLLLTFLPLRKVYSSSNKSFIAANGQFILIDKQAYNEIGGHESVRAQVVEDMELARSIKTKGYKVLTALGDNSISCRMYSSFMQSFNGFTKNFFRGFKINPFIFLFLLVFLQLVFTIPLLLWPFELRYLLIVAIINLGRFLISSMSKQNALLNVLFHPFQMFVLFLIGINSVLASYIKGAEWKGRRI